MAKKIRFPLKMKNGTEVRTLDELKENFNLESILGYFSDGKLATWLSDRYYDEKAEAVSALSSDMPDLSAKLCEILEVEYKAEDDEADVEVIARRREKLRFLSAVTDNRDILDNVDIVAVSQADLFDILDEKPEKVYLYGEKFSIPFAVKNICYIGINNPIIILNYEKTIEHYKDAGIKFEKVTIQGIYSYTQGEKLFLEGNFKEAFSCIEKDANNDNPRAMYLLARFYSAGYNVVEIDSYTKRRWCEKAYQFKEPLSMFGYTLWYWVSEQEKQSIYGQILNDIKKMAENGDAFSQGILALMYGNGWGVEKNLEKSFEWDNKAANQGYVPSMHNLAEDYDYGTGVEESRDTAIEWYKKAADKGYSHSQYAIGNKLGGYEGIEWLKKAAYQGDGAAMNALGVKYELGIVVSKDRKKAREWYKKAIRHGSSSAEQNLKELNNPFSALKDKLEDFADNL